MKALINIEQFSNHLMNIVGVSESQTHQIVSYLAEGLDIQLSEIGEFELNAGAVSIQMLNNQGEIPDKQGNDPLRICNFVVNIKGIDDTYIKSITIPKLSYDSTELLTVDLEYVPFKFWPEKEHGITGHMSY